MGLFGKVFFGLCFDGEQMTGKIADVQPENSACWRYLVEKDGLFQVSFFLLVFGLYKGFRNG